MKVNTIPAAERLYVDLLPENWSGVLPGLPQEVVDELAERAREAERQLHQQKPARVKRKAAADPRQASPPSRPSRVMCSTLPDGANVVPERGDGRLTLNFDQQINWDLADALAALPPTLTIDRAPKSTSTPARSVFVLNGTPEVRSFREDRSIMVDVGR